MTKQLLSLFLIWTILMVSFGATNISAQTISKDLVNDLKTPKSAENQAEYDFSKRIKLNKSNNLDSPIDFEKIEKEANKNLPKRKMSKKAKTFWVLFAVGMAALVFVAIKYYKECEIEDPDCPIGETICPCLKYKDETK